jgi:hypothetical protein
MTEGEQETIHLPYMLDILREKILSPLTLAKIENKEACLTLLLIEQLYNRAFDEHKKRWVVANEKDLQIIKRISRPQVMMKYLSDYLVTTRMPSQMIICLMWIVSSWYRAWNKKDLQHEGNCHRRAWLIETQALERKRIQEMRDFLCNRSRVLLGEIQELHQEGEWNQQVVDELTQLSKTHSALFPDRKFTVAEIEVDNFLQTLSTELLESENHDFC